MNRKMRRHIEKFGVKVVERVYGVDNVEVPVNSDFILRLDGKEIIRLLGDKKSIVSYLKYKMPDVMRKTGLEAGLNLPCILNLSRGGAYGVSYNFQSHEKAPTRLISSSFNELDNVSPM